MPYLGAALLVAALAQEDASVFAVTTPAPAVTTPAPAATDARAAKNAYRYVVVGDPANTDCKPPECLSRTRLERSGAWSSAPLQPGSFGQTVWVIHALNNLTQ